MWRSFPMNVRISTASSRLGHTASVANAITPVTVTPTKSDSNATVENLDGSDMAITEADTRKSWREIAVQHYGAKLVAEEWSTESSMRSRVRRLGKKARFLMESGYRDLAAGR